MDMNSSKEQREQGRTAGFSLVEIMVAMTILSVGVLAMSGLMVTVSRSQIRATNLIEGTEAVQSKIEELRAVAAAGTSDTVQLAVGGSLTTAVANHIDTTRAGTNRSFVRLWVVEAGPGGTRKVTVRGEPRDDLPVAVPPVDITTQLLIL
jgi:prepilin-type N-terminal cleavage/methylation domain-containing protein